MTFTELCTLEPALRELEEFARNAAREEEAEQGEYRCGNACWYSQVKPRLLRLVGWGRTPRHPVLSSSEAYMTATDYLYNLMPDCRRCACLSVASLA